MKVPFITNASKAFDAWLGRQSRGRYIAVTCALCALFMLGLELLQATVIWGTEPGRFHALSPRFWVLVIPPMVLCGLTLVPDQWLHWINRQRRAWGGTEKGPPFWSWFTRVMVFSFLLGLVGRVSTPSKRATILPPAWAVTQGQIMAVRDARCCGDAIEPKVEYRYHIDNQYFTANRVSFRGDGNGKLTQKEAETLRLGIGKQVRVFYDPQDPQFATLLKSETPLSATTTLSLLAGTLASWALVMAFCLRWVRNKESEFLQPAEPPPPLPEGLTERWEVTR